MALEKFMIDAQEYMNSYMTTSLAMASRFYYPREKVDLDAKVYVELGESGFEGDDNTMPLEAFIAGLRAMAGKAPEGVDVVIELGTDGYDDDRYATYEMGYWRDPTPEERAEREELNRNIDARAQEEALKQYIKERDEYERLKEKFG